MKVAISTENGETITKDHFGEGKKFLIYELSNDGIKLLEERENDSPEEKEHGSKEKAMAISSILEDIPVLVGYQFGPNIIRIKDKFLPIVSRELSIEKTLALLERYHGELMNEEKRRGNVVIMNENGLKIVRVSSTNAKDF